VIDLAARHKLPAIYPIRQIVEEGRLAFSEPDSLGGQVCLAFLGTQLVPLLSDEDKAWPKWGLYKSSV
jgi:hypothetical protein